MVVFERSIWIHAPLDEVWAFHGTPDSLTDVTPDWMNLRIEEVTGPTGDETTHILEAGTVVRMSIRPFNVGPKQSWVSRIVDCRSDNRTAMFRDTMIDGPFPEWTHTHRFYAEDGGTRVIDRIEYRLPFLGRLSRLGRLGLAPLFAYRHRQIREIFE